MKHINELLGFVVLTSPLWLIVLLLILGTGIAVKVSMRFRTTAVKVVVGLGVVALFLIVPFADEIAGRIYFSHLCATEAGIKVYHTVELPAEYWDSAGKPKFYDERNGNFTLKGYRVDYASGTYTFFPRIEKAGYKRLDETGRVLGEVTDFLYWGGWIRRNFSPHNTATGCKDRREHSRNLVRQIFKN